MLMKQPAEKSMIDLLITSFKYQPFTKSFDKFDEILCLHRSKCHRRSVGPSSQLTGIMSKYSKRNYYIKQQLLECLMCTYHVLNANGKRRLNGSVERCASFKPSGRRRPSSRRCISKLFSEHFR